MSKDEVWTKFELTLDETAANADAIINCLTAPYIDDSGLQKIYLYSFAGATLAYDQSVLDNLVTRAAGSSTTYLAVRKMNALPSSPKQSMVDFAKSMINNSMFLSQILVDDNTLNSDQTKDLLTTITAASCVYALDYLDISDANFDSDETCTELANLLNKANDLYNLIISD